MIGMKEELGQKCQLELNRDGLKWNIHGGRRLEGEYLRAESNGGHRALQ